MQFGQTGWRTPARKNFDKFFWFGAKVLQNAADNKDG
jgi:hypothetical protein